MTLVVFVLSRLKWINAHIENYNGMVRTIIGKHALTKFLQPVQPQEITFSVSFHRMEAIPPNNQNLNWTHQHETKIWKNQWAGDWLQMSSNDKGMHQGPEKSQKQPKKPLNCGMKILSSSSIISTVINNYWKKSECISDKLNEWSIVISQQDRKLSDARRDTWAHKSPRATEMRSWWYTTMNDRWRRKSKSNFEKSNIEMQNFEVTKV